MFCFRVCGFSLQNNDFLFNLAFFFNPGHSFSFSGRINDDRFVDALFVRERGSLRGVLLVFFSVAGSLESSAFTVSLSFASSVETASRVCQVSVVSKVHNSSSPK